MSMKNQQTHDCRKELKKARLKATPARLNVLKILENTKQPIDILSIISYFKKNNVPADPATIFRIINSFTENGITKQIELNEGKFRYELANKKDHHHLICELCGKIEDIEDPIVPKFEKHIKLRHKFTVKRHSLEFFGICENCQK